MDLNSQQFQGQNRTPQQQPTVGQDSKNSKGKKQRNNSSRRLSDRTSRLIGGLLAVAVIALLVFAGLWLSGRNNEASQINKKAYQAVFLSNGQVYFGKLDTLNASYAKLTDIYYLQAKQTVQPKQNSADEQPQNVQLVKLGNELHGPENAMQINREQIVFWENLKSDGKVTKAIEQYQSQPSNSNSNTSTPEQPTSQSSNNVNTNNSDDSGSTSTTPSSDNNSTAPSADNSTPTAPKPEN